VSQIVDKLSERDAKRARALEHYQGRRIYQPDYKGFPSDMHAEMIVNVSYDAPATEEFTVVSQSGPKWMINRVLKRLLETERESLQDENRERVQITSENYDFTLLETQDSGDGCPYDVKIAIGGTLAFECLAIPGPRVQGIAFHDIQLFEPGALWYFRS
jgi:hypothetical protein